MERCLDTDEGCLALTAQEVTGATVVSYVRTISYVLLFLSKPASSSSYCLSLTMLDCSAVPLLIPASMKLPPRLI